MYVLPVATLGRDDLVLTASSVGCPPFPTLIEAAVHGGFAALSLWPPETYGAALEAGYGAEQLRRMLDDAGVVAHEVDALVAWAGPNDPGEPYLRAAPRAFVLETAAALGARQANAIVVGERGTSHEAIAEVVDAMCEEAAAFDVRVGIEFARGSLVRTIDDFLAVRALLPSPRRRRDRRRLADPLGTVDPRRPRPRARRRGLLACRSTTRPRCGPTTSGAPPTRGASCPATAPPISPA